MTACAVLAFAKPFCAYKEGPKKMDMSHVYRRNKKEATSNTGSTNSSKKILVVMPLLLVASCY